jgi:UDP-N-acetylmuramyl pentapeptide synthase
MGSEADPKGPVLQLTAAWVAAHMGGVVTSGDATREFGDVSIDPRTLKAGELYVGIRGERFDDAEFAGAAGVVVPRGWNASAVAQPFRAADAGLKPRATSVVVIEVGDTTAAQLRPAPHRGEVVRLDRLRAASG